MPLINKIIGQQMNSDIENTKELPIIAITGASGFIGKNLVRTLANSGKFEIRVLTRNMQKASFDHGNITVIEGDLEKPGMVEDFVLPGCTVVNLAYNFNATNADNRNAAMNLITICKKNKIKRLIHCSTAAVFGRVKKDVINENTPCLPRSEYGVTKLSIEDMFFSEAKGNYEFVNLRPTAVFGADGQALIKLIMDLRTGGKILNYVRSCLFNTRKLNLVSVNNVTAAIIFMIKAEAQVVSGQTYIISEDDDLNNNFRYVENYLYKEFVGNGFRIPRLKIPLVILSLLLRLLGRDSSNPYQVYDSAKILGAGFNYVASLDSELNHFVAWYKSKLVGQHHENL